MAEGEKIVTRIIEDEMKNAYIDYSMSVIVSRALPDVRDGLKPVHRRVLYGMSELGLASNRPYKKSARIVGEVLGKFHPHGDSAVYDTMVRMAQPWSLRYPLVDGQGNFGSIDGDNPAAMRYTEARLRKIAEELLADLEKNTVDFRLNFDDSLQEPTVLPAKVPNLLINGASGIAVGMATNMPPHNLVEVVNATKAYIDNTDIDIVGLMEYVKGPDFPTGATIYGVEGIQQAYATGKGRVVMRAKADIEIDSNDRERIIITEIPYQVNKATTIEKISHLVNEKRLEGISYVNDESDRQGMRIVVDLKRDANAQVVLNKLYQLTPLQSSFSINNVALVNGRPQTLNLKDMIRHFVDHRHEVVTRRTQYELEEAEKRAHILKGLLIALDNLDEVIALIRASQTADLARAGLIERFELSEMQAKAILDMRLQRLTGLEREKIENQFKDLMEKIDYYRAVLADVNMRMGIIKDELDEMIEKFGDERRTNITYSDGEIRIEDLIANEDMIVTITNQGYIKRTLATAYQAQGRGGTGFRGTGTKDSDFVEHLISTRTHNYMLFFTEMGKCFWLRVYQIPQGERTNRGRPIQNMINIDREDRVKAFITVESLDDQDFLNSHYIIMATRKGQVKKTLLRDYSRPRANGILAITINEGDELLEAKLTDGNSHIVIGTREGYAVRFEEEKVREMGRTAMGVRGITLQNDEDAVVGMLVVSDDQANILVVSEQGYGKQTSVEEYRVTNRGGKGVKTINVSDKIGKLVAVKKVENPEEEDLMIITKMGITIRMEVSGINVLGRNTQGVRLIKLKGGDEIASATIVVETEEEKTAVEGDEETPDTPETDTQDDTPDTDE
ncbi:DNA gyrase subunit A [Pontibacter sp. G13]|uniref:DNA gyrase subunit A n=1 Tax=Pontibacter sp. G13 TaxID=3074898 RepID=UPI00288B302D|nr:DNA gyrase subunit A [Pontibacter sp. G13]WNJ20403.1 DNA gyrase subunit A [Pontibacter sp. G13]